MPRATYLWTVQNPGRSVLAAFTVKHELRSWLEKQEHDYRSRLMIIRHHDGGYGATGPDTQDWLDPMTLESVE